MTMPPPEICDRIRKLFGMLGATPNEAENARAKLLALLAEHGLTWNDLGDVLAASVGTSGASAPKGSAPDGASYSRSQTPNAAPQVNALDLVLRLIELHVVIGDAERMAAALWILHTYIYDSFRHTPRLALLSPVNGCGKTTLLSLLALLVRYPSITANTTPAVIYYDLARSPYTTWLIDEADNLDLLGHGNGVLRSVLNMGHTRGATVCRMVRGEPHKIQVFAPVAIAAIGALPFPLLRRSIEINMQRLPPGCSIDLLDDTSPQWAASRDQIQLWAKQFRLVLNPEMPPQLHNRAADNWRVLLAIADDLGHGDEARSAAIKLSSNRVYTEPGIALLADILTVFEQANVDRFASKGLVAALLDLNDGDWNEWRGPKEDRPPHKLSQSELAATLRPFHIRPRTIWPAKRQPGTRSSRGYLRSQFERAWDSYCRQADKATQRNKINTIAT
jgi:Protein of unknown function (DUF3631)